MAKANIERESQNRTSVLIVARSDQIRESLRVLLRTIPRVGSIHQADSGPLVLSLLRNSNPFLVLLDLDIHDDELRATLEQIKAGWPQRRCIILLNSELDRSRVQELGADVVLVKGTRATTILKAVEGLLSNENRMERGKTMENYRFHPPQLRYTKLPYEILATGVTDCRHELLENEWCERISVQDGIVFVIYTCRHCGRQVCQSLDEVTAPTSWMEVGN